MEIKEHFPFCFCILFPWQFLLLVASNEMCSQHQTISMITWQFLYHLVSMVIIAPYAIKWNVMSTSNNSCNYKLEPTWYRAILRQNNTINLVWLTWIENDSLFLVYSLFTTESSLHMLELHNIVINMKDCFKKNKTFYRFFPLLPLYDMMMDPLTRRMEEKEIANPLSTSLFHGWFPHD